MRNLLRAAVLALLLPWLAPASTATPAHAFGDQCHRDVKATGDIAGSMSSARASAIAAWESAVARQYGRRYADWYYSADRTFTCSWDASGRRIRCVAIAGPCGRKR